MRDCKVSGQQPIGSNFESMRFGWHAHSQPVSGLRQPHQRPRRNRASSSFMPIWRQVGRPWLHWSERSVTSI